MHKLLVAAAIATLAATPVLAQPATQIAPSEANLRAYGPPYPKPVDHGPWTPQANAAYMGGGMVLQGAPGAPPPQPQPTPPGQIPPNMVQ